MLTCPHAQPVDPLHTIPPFNYVLMGVSFRSVRPYCGLKAAKPRHSRIRHLESVKCSSRSLLRAPVVELEKQLCRRDQLEFFQNIKSVQLEETKKVG